MTEDRLIDLETRIAYQEDLIETLNKTIYQQQQQIDRLAATCEALARHIQSLAEAGASGNALGHERPPHY